MGVTNPNKQVSVDRITCDGTLKVRIAFTGTPSIMENPADIVLVLDRSGSMAGPALASLKVGAKSFIDIIDESTDGSQDGQIGGGSRIAIVSFSNTATVDEPLITSVADLKDAVDALTADGSTNHADAFTKAGELFDPTSTNQKILVMFTDGRTTAGPDPATVATALKAAGVVIYAIGLTGTNGIDEATLNAWASDPDSEHVLVSPNFEELEELFKDLAASISEPGATNIVVEEVVNPDFVITSVLPTNKGTTNLVNSNTIRWTIDVLGATNTETAVLEFFIRHVAATSGTKLVNESITYSDAEGNEVEFPDPTVTVDCGTIITPEECPTPVNVSIGGCEDSVIVDVGSTQLISQGRILQVNTTIRNVCPGKRVALAVILTEVDPAGVEHQRGLKVVTVPAHNATSCRDVQVRCIKFVLPEDLNVSGGTPGAMCSTRNLRVRLLSNVIDSGFECCNTVVTTI